LATQAKKQGRIPDQFMEEDIDEVQDFLPDVFHDPAITSWALVLTDGEPLPKPPTKGPFTVTMNRGLPPPAQGYANSNWVNVDTLDNLPDAEEIFKGIISKNPKYYVGITSADHNFVKFQDPHKQGVAEAGKKFVDPELARTKQYAKQHYPGMADPESAFDKWVSRSLMHSDKDDHDQDKRLQQLAADIAAVKTKIQSLQQNADYLDESR
jgi:hypothetical protein